MARIDFWVSIGSTYSYLTVMRIDAVARDHGLDIVWKPFNVRTIMMEYGNSPFIGKPVKAAHKAAHMWRDIERRAHRYGLSPRLPAPYPLNDLALPNAIACLGMEDGWGENFTRAAYRRWFEEGLRPDDGTGLHDSLRQAGQDPDATIGRAQRPESTTRLADQTREGRDLGVFGSPSFIVGGELFWGDDRLEDAVQWARDGRLS